jgi:protein O-mannosyl-transferase
MPGRFFSRLLWVALALTAAIWFVYSPAWHYGFVNFDDPDYVTANQRVASGLSWRNLIWALTTPSAANWFPLTWLSHMLDVTLYGMSAGAHHFTNILLHAASSILLLGLLYRMTDKLGSSIFVAAMFAVHPVHVESVAWVAERKDVLSTLFGMLTLWAYWAYVREPRVGRYVLVFLSLALGLMSKAMLVTLPLVLLLLDYWPLRRKLHEEAAFASGSSFLRRVSSGKLWLVWEKVPLLLLAAVSSIVTFVVQRRGGSVIRLAVLPFGLRVENALVSYVAYIGQALWPTRLAAFYPYPQSIPAGPVIVAAAVLIAATFLAIHDRRRYPFILVGWLWYVITLLPVIGLVQVGEQSRADRYLYVPLVGLSLIAGWGAPELVSRWKHGRIALSTAAAVTVVACAVVARHQVHYWADSTTLWTHAVDVTVANDFAHNNLGAALLAEGRVEEAAAQFDATIQIKPEVAPPHFNLANALAKQGKVDAAITQYREALRINAEYAEAHNNLGAALATQGKFEEARLHYSEALRIRPTYADAQYNLGNALAAQGNITNAMAHYAEAVRLRPDYAEAHNGWGAALASQGKFDEAMAHYAEAARLQPGYADVHNNWGVSLSSQGKLGEAIAQYTEALRLNSDYADARNNLGNALAKSGRAGEAIVQFADAARLRPDSAAIRNSLGLVLAEQGLVDDAIREFQESLRIEPNQPLTHRSIAALLERRGQVQEAIHHLEAALQLDPDDPAASAELSRLTGRAQRSAAPIPRQK